MACIASSLLGSGGGGGTGDGMDGAGGAGKAPAGVCLIGMGGGT
jgi:hypothetical protein